MEAGRGQSVAVGILCVICESTEDGRVTRHLVLVFIGIFESHVNEQDFSAVIRSGI